MRTEVIVGFISSMQVLRWYLVFEFDQIIPQRFVDDFPFSEEWSFLQYKHANCLYSFGYMNKHPQIIGHISDLTIYRKYTTYKFNFTTNTGNCILSINPEQLYIPNFPVPIRIITRSPYTSVYKFKFDFHIMMILLIELEDIVMLDKHVYLTYSSVLYKQIKIEITENVLSYTGLEDQDMFQEFCERVEKRYIDEHVRCGKLFEGMGEPEIHPKSTHLSIAYEVWYRGSRENQRDWPRISIGKINDRSVEFPKDSNIYYTPLLDNQYVGLSLRHDDNQLLYIPKLYVKDHRIVPSYLYDYINNTQTYKPFQLSSYIKDTIKKYGSQLKTYREKLSSDKIMEINCNGEIIHTHPNPNTMYFNGKIVGVCHRDPGLTIECQAQVLDSSYKRVMVLIKNKWVESKGPRIIGIPALPHYYRSIVHDYHKLGRLKNGKYMDLTHIGIVDPRGTDIITFPIDPTIDMYIGTGLETHRLCTFKYKPYVFESRRVLINGT